MRVYADRIEEIYAEREKIKMYYTYVRRTSIYAYRHEYRGIRALVAVAATAVSLLLMMSDGGMLSLGRGTQHPLFFRDTISLASSATVSVSTWLLYSFFFSVLFCVHCCVFVRQAAHNLSNQDTNHFSLTPLILFSLIFFFFFMNYALFVSSFCVSIYCWLHNILCLFLCGWRRELIFGPLFNSEVKWQTARVCVYIQMWYIQW